MGAQKFKDGSRDADYAHLEMVCHPQSSTYYGQSEY